MNIAEICLGDIDQCVKCSGLRGGDSPLTRDHIIPIKAGKDHKDLLFEIVVSRINIATLCRADHDTVDRDKMRIYWQSGLVGLVNQIANYPRFNDPNILQLQEYQWTTLFEKVLQSIHNLNGETPPHLKNNYQLVAELVDLHLLNWRNGRFV